MERTMLLEMDKKSDIDLDQNGRYNEENTQSSVPFSTMQAAQESELSDHQIIELVLAEQKEKFSILVDRYKEKVIRLCVSLISDLTQAEDAAQEVFLKAYRGLAKFRMDSTFSTWLYRITSNHCMDILRKRSRKQEYSWDSMVEAAGDKLGVYITSPDNHSSAVENRELINQVLDSINHDYREILTLREMDRMSYDEIAETLEITVNAVKSRLRRARRDFEHKLNYFMS